MRGVYCDGSSLSLRQDLPKPTPGTGEVALRVRMAGICDTDVQLAQGYMNFRGILGHEFIGQTDDGSRVTAEINNSCLVCPTCRAGLSHHCPDRSVLGILNHDGAMADEVTVPQRNVHFVPDSISDHEAVFIEPLAAAFRITEQVHFSTNTRVAIVGDGKLGLLSAWVVRLSGASVTLVGKHSEKLALAGDGIETCHLNEAGRFDRSQDVVVDCTGSASGLEVALRMVSPCGTIVLKTTVAGDHGLSLAPVVIDEVRMIGSRCGPFPLAIAALESKRIDVSPLIEAVYPLDAAEAAFRAATRSGARKVLLEI